MSSFFFFCLSRTFSKCEIILVEQSQKSQSDKAGQCFYIAAPAGGAYIRGHMHSSIVKVDILQYIEWNLEQETYVYNCPGYKSRNKKRTMQ